MKSPLMKISLKNYGDSEVSIENSTFRFTQIFDYVQNVGIFHFSSSITGLVHRLE